MLGQEVFLFSCPIIRFNKYGWRNARILILSQDHIYVLKQKNRVKKEVRLRVAYQELRGLTISLHTDSHEIVAHLEVQSDLRISCQGARKDIVDTIKMFYVQKARSNLPIFGVRQRSLNLYTTQDSDVAKGISRMPLSLARLNDEDLVDIELLARNQENLFDLAEDDEVDELNQAFSSLVLQRGEISPTLD